MPAWVSPELERTPRGLSSPGSREYRVPSNVSELPLSPSPLSLFLLLHLSACRFCRGFKARAGKSAGTSGAIRAHSWMTNLEIAMTIALRRYKIIIIAHYCIRFVNNWACTCFFQDFPQHLNCWNLIFRLGTFDFTHPIVRNSKRFVCKNINNLARSSFRLKVTRVFREINTYRDAESRAEVCFRERSNALRNDLVHHAIVVSFPFEIVREWAVSSDILTSITRTIVLSQCGFRQICLQKYTARNIARAREISVDASYAKRDTRQHENPRVNENALLTLAGTRCFTTTMPPFAAIIYNPFRNATGLSTRIMVTHM